jgi:arginyl-tRNA synthetase
MIELKAALKKEILARTREKYALDEAELEIIGTPQQSFGDLSLSFPFRLAKRLKANPRALAVELLPLLSGLEGVEKAEVAGLGYINLFLDRGAFFRKSLHRLGRTALSPEYRKVIIEHTNINPNKAAHIGHLRNACLGDTLALCLRYKGEKVEVQNYIDDTGVQVVDVVFGLMDLEKKTEADLDGLGPKFDYYCWDLYARTADYLEAHPESQGRKGEILKNIEHGRDPEAAMARAVSRRIIRAHLNTMKRIGVGYELLPCESSILGLKFWEKAFNLLQEKDAIQFSREGETAGCWVMRLAGAEEKEKIIVRSDGTVTYVGKDIAYQLWKFGLLGRDFYYEPFIQEGGKILWITTTVPGPHTPSFGKASRVYNVIDSRQAYLQKIVAQGLKALGYEDQAANSVHFSYEMVGLSPQSLKEINYQVPDSDKERSFLEVSGRKGLGVKADDLLDRLEAKASAEVEKRNPDRRPSSAPRSPGHAGGALRYFMQVRAQLLSFLTLGRGPQFRGEVHLQYAYVRLNSIFKLFDRTGVGARSWKAVRTGPIPLQTPAEEGQTFGTSFCTPRSSRNMSCTRSIPWSSPIWRSFPLTCARRRTPTTIAIPSSARTTSP